MSAVPARYIKNASDELAASRGYYVDEAAAERVRKWVETYCIQSKHPFTGQPLKLLDWQWNDIVLPLYGWFRPDRGRNGEHLRRFKNSIIFCPKKVGKTTLLAGLALYHVFEFPGSEAYCIASDVQQASVLYNQAADFAETHEWLQERLWPRRNIKTIEYQETRSKLAVLSSKPEGKSGFSANYVCYDEFSEWPSANARIIWDRLVNAGMARINSLQVVISTAQYDRTHLGYEQYRLACDIRDGKLTDLHTLPVIYSLPEEADWTKEENWWPVCPSIDVTVSKDYYRDEFQKVKNSPQDETRFRTFLLCQWVGHSEQWINTQIWDKCKEPFKEEDLYGLPAIVGLDCARKWDLAAYVLLIRKDDHVYLLPRVFTPAQLAKHKETTDKVPYRRWAKNGYVTLTDGDVIDYEEIRNSLKRDAENFSIDAVYYDPYGFEESRRLLEEEGFNMIEATQSPAIMAPATNHFERLVLDGKIRHNGNECLSWCLGNCTVKVDQHERIQIEKRKSTGRIDAAVAAVIGCVGLLAEKEEADWEGPTFFS